MYSNQEAIELFNQMTAMGAYYDSGRPIAVDPDIIIKDVLSKLKVSREDIILDVGCGTGVVTFPLARHCAFVHALDAGAKVIEKARERAKQENIKNIAYYQGSALALPFERDSFDHVLMYAVIHYLENEAQVSQCVAELVRVCKPGGRILIAEIPDHRVRLEFEKRAKTPQEARMLEHYKNNRAEYDRLAKEHVRVVTGTNSLVLDCQRICAEGVKLGCRSEVLLQDIRQPFSLTRRDVLLVKHKEGTDL